MKKIYCLVFLLFPFLIFSQQNKTKNLVKQTAKPIEMIYVKGGLFQMGSSYRNKNERPVHLVRVADFYIGKYEVTQLQWKSLMGDKWERNRGDKLPVACINWIQAQKFIERLNVKTGKKYRLPTEAEWEYAARGGNSTHFFKFAGSDNLNKVGWYLSNSFVDSNEGLPQPVGSKQPNELGIYDMSGNVWEICNDWYASNYYSRSTIDNPKGPSTGEGHVIRGGSYMDTIQASCVTTRQLYHPQLNLPSVGFRLVLSK